MTPVVVLSGLYNHVTTLSCKNKRQRMTETEQPDFF